MKSERFSNGMAKLNEIDGEAGRNVIESLECISPELAEFIIEFPFGDIYTRPGLDLKSREIATIASLVSIGSVIPQLKVHINGALNVGCTKEEVTETILQMAVYAGFPKAINGMLAAKEVFRERKLIS